MFFMLYMNLFTVLFWNQLTMLFRHLLANFLSKLLTTLELVFSLTMLDMLCFTNNLGFLLIFMMVIVLILTITDFDMFNGTLQGERRSQDEMDSETNKQTQDFHHCI